MQWVQAGIDMSNKWSDDAALKARQDKADARQATEDAWTTEERGRTREKNTREDGARKVVQDQAGVMITDAEKSPDWRKAFGLPDIASPMLSVGGIKDYRERGPKSEAPQPDAPAQATDAAPVSYAEPGDVKPATPVAAAPVAPNPFAQQRAAAISLMKIGQAQGDYKMVQEGQAAVQKVNANEGSTGIINWAATASDAEVAQAMRDITLDKRNKYEAVFDPKTGFTNIKSGDAEATFTRPQLGMYLAAKHRLNSGDPAAYADMKAISAELTAKDAEARKSLIEISAANNLTNYHSRSADNKDELASVKLMAAQAAAARGVGGKAEKPVGPHISKSKTDEGTEYLDDNSGAFGVDVPAVAAKPAVSHIFSADEPAVAGSPRRVEWRTAGGQLLPDGPQALYPHLAVNRQPGGTQESPVARQSSQAPAALPPGLVVGASTKQPDGTYSVNGRSVTLKGGKVTEIK